MASPLRKAYTPQTGEINTRGICPSSERAEYVPKLKPQRIVLWRS